MIEVGHVMARTVCRTSLFLSAIALAGACASTYTHRALLPSTVLAPVVTVAPDTALDLLIGVAIALPEQRLPICAGDSPGLIDRLSSVRPTVSMSRCPPPTHTTPMDSMGRPTVPVMAVYPVQLSVETTEYQRSPDGGYDVTFPTGPSEVTRYHCARTSARPGWTCSFVYRSQWRSVGGAPAA